MTAEDAADWECIRGLVTSTPYDLAGETRLFFRRLKDYRPEIERVLRGFHDDPDFAGLDLHALLDGEGL